MHRIILALAFALAATPAVARGGIGGPINSGAGVLLAGLVVIGLVIIVIRAVFAFLDEWRKP